MSCDLERVFSPLAARLPENENSWFALAADSLPRPEVAIRTDRVVIQKTYSARDSFFRRDALHWYADKPTYCHLGLLAAAVLFSHEIGDIVLALDHRASDIRRLIVRRNDAIDPGYPGYHSRPLGLNYYPRTVEKHPWDCFAGNPRELPGFFLTNADECVTTDAGWATRDTVVGFGTDDGFARLVELLLNASRPSSSAVEFELEGEGGFRGVAPFSCDVRLLLPGAFGWNDDFGLGGQVAAR